MSKWAFAHPFFDQSVVSLPQHASNDVVLFHIRLEYLDGCGTIIRILDVLIPSRTIAVVDIVAVMAEDVYRSRSANHEARGQVGAIVSKRKNQSSRPSQRKSRLTHALRHGSPLRNNFSMPNVVLFGWKMAAIYAILIAIKRATGSCVPLPSLAEI